MDDRKLNDLTVDEFEIIIKRTVKKSVAEAMMEFALEADIEAQVAYEAELNDMLRSEMQTYGKLQVPDAGTLPKADD